MAGKSNVNTRFVVLLSVGILAVCGLLWLAVVKLALKSGEDHIRAGDAAMAVQDYEKARRLYGKAVNKDITRVDWVEKWLGAISSWTPETETAYRDAFFTEYLPALRQIATVDRTDVDSYDRYLSVLHRQMMYGYSRPQADQLSQEVGVAAGFFERQPGVDPSWKRLLRYRGLAQEMTMQAGGVLNDNQVALVGEDLNAALEADPKDSEVATALVRWTVTSASRGSEMGQAARVREAREKAIQIADAFLAQNPEDPGMRVMRLWLDVDAAIVTAGEGKAENVRVRAVLDAMAAMKDDLDSVFAVVNDAGPAKVRLETLMQARRLETLIDPEARNARTLATFEAFAKSEPDDADLMWLLAQTRRDMGDLDGASALFDRMSGLPVTPVSLEGLRRFDLQRQALIGRATVSLDQLEQMRANGKGEDKAPELIALAKELRGKFAGQVTEDNPALVLLDGRIAEATGDVGEALRLYKRYNNQVQRGRADGLWREARAATLLGQLGTARSALQDLLVVDPNDLRAILSLADTHARLQETAEATELYKKALRLSPDNTFAQEGLTRVQALTNPESLDDPVLSLLLTSRKVRVGGGDQAADPAGATKLLEDSIAKLDYDPRIASELISARVDGGDIAGARAVAAEGVRRHPDSEQLRRLNTALAGSDPTEVLLTMIDLSDRPEAEKLISVAGVCLGRGLTEKLDETLARLEQVSPDDPRVIDMLFVRALDRKDFAKAESLAQKATATNLDRVRGLSYAARLAAAKGNGTEAVSLLQQAAALGTGDSSVYRLLGVELRENGQTDDAVRAFEQSLGVRPDDLQTIVEYVSTLAAARRYQEALDVARRMQKFGQTSPQFVEMWLSLEAAAGGVEGRNLAIRQREQLLAGNAADRGNKIALAQLYIEGKRWADAKTLIDQLGSEGPSLQTTELLARWAADQGRVGPRDGLTLAQEAYQRYISSLGNDATSEPYLSLARFMVGRGRPDLAVRAADSAIARENKETMDGTKLKGDLLMSLGQPASAAESFKAVVEAGKDTEDQVYRQRLVEMYIRIGEFDKAAEEQGKLPSSVTGTLTALLQRAEIAAGRGDTAGQRKMLDEAVAKYPKEPLVYIKRAQSMIDKPGLMNDLMADIDAAMRLSPNDWRALRVRAAALFGADRRPEAMRDLRAALRANPTLDDALFAVMNEMLNDNRAGEAMDAAREVLDKRPTDAPLMSQLGKLFEARQDWARAAEMYKRAWDTRKSPNDGGSFIDTALRKSPPDTDGANAVIRELAELSGGPVEASPGLLAAQSLVLRARGSEEFAQQQMTKAFDLSLNDDYKMQTWQTNAERFYVDKPAADEIRYYKQLRARYTDADVRAWLDLFTSKRELSGEVSIDEAATTLDGLTRKDGVPATVRVLAFRELGNMHYARGEYDKAVEVWQRGLTVLPDNWELNNNCAYTLSAKLGKHDEALKLAEKAVAADPGRSEPYDTLGGIYIALGKLDDAERMIQLGEQRSASYTARVTMSITRAKLEAAKGNKEDALNRLDQAESILLAIAGRDPVLEEEIRVTRERIRSDQ